jgi:hypothetical protein
MTQHQQEWIASYARQTASFDKNISVRPLTLPNYSIKICQFCGTQDKVAHIHGQFTDRRDPGKKSVSDVIFGSLFCNPYIHFYPFPSPTSPCFHHIIKS